MTFEYRTLGATGLEVSSIGMGCVTFGREIDEQSSFAVLDRARERGINLFDTAASYGAGASEKVLGRWMADRDCRDEIVLATKVNGTLTRDHVLKSARESLARLRTDRIDLFQLHSWDEETPLEETLGALTTLIETGVTKAIGCSNWNARQLSEALELAAAGNAAAIECVQPPYNLVQRKVETDLLPLCAERNLGVISYSPLAAGFLAGKYRRGEKPAKGTRFDVIPGHQPIYFTDHGFAVLERLESLAHESGHSMVQLSFGWILSRPNVSSVLVGARNTAQIDQAFEAMELDLSGNMLDRLTGVDR